MGKNFKKMKIDEDKTVNIKNYVLRERIDSYLEKKDAQSFNNLMNCITDSRVLLPANVNAKKEPLPNLIKNNDGDFYIPAYTNKEQIPAEPKPQAIMNIPYTSVNHMAADPNNNVVGIVINPFTNNLIFKPELIQKVEEVENAKKNGQPIPGAQQMKTVQMTEEQYVLFERRQFETVFLPGKLFSGGKSFVDELCEKREVFVDSLYEESYKEKRMYPYLDEDFSVMPMNITEELLVVRVDMPPRDMAPGLCFRIYLSWDDTAGQGRYFMIEAAKEKGRAILEEVSGEKKRINHGEAPVEGAELQTIIDLLGSTADTN